MMSDGETTQGRAEGRLEDIPEEMKVDYSKAESVASIAKPSNSKQVSYNMSVSRMWMFIIVILWIQGFCCLISLSVISVCL